MQQTLRGALESRLALEATTAYLELDEPELAAYFLSQALECADSRIVSDHFPCPLEWDMVDSLLDTARVTEEELDMAREALRARGFLPEPEAGSRFHYIDEQWYRHSGSYRWVKVTPPPKRC